MSTDARATQNDTDDRPDNCICQPYDGVPCWPCYRTGYEAANPDGTGREEDG